MGKSERQQRAQATEERTHDNDTKVDLGVRLELVLRVWVLRSSA